MNPEEVLRRAERAGQILADPVVKETLDLIEREVHDAWVQCPVRDAEGREALWRMAVTARKFRDVLRGTMESGKLAKDEIARKQNVVERVFRR